MWEPLWTSRRIRSWEPPQTCQGQEICPSGCIDTYALARELDERYFGRDLPHKFKFGVTGCQNNCLKAEENDLGVKGGIKVRWKEDGCIQSGVCEKVCRSKAISLKDSKIEVDEGLCNFCGRCAKSCPVDAWGGSPEDLKKYLPYRAS